ncbi:unnamed protein product [Urochloa humidicola]
MLIAAGQGQSVLPQANIDGNLMSEVPLATSVNEGSEQNTQHEVSSSQIVDSQQNSIMPQSQAAANPPVGSRTTRSAAAKDGTYITAQQLKEQAAKRRLSNKKK